MKMFCEKCGKECPEDVRFCPYCGKELQERKECEIEQQPESTAQGTAA